MNSAACEDKRKMAVGTRNQAITEDTMNSAASEDKRNIAVGTRHQTITRTQ